MGELRGWHIDGASPMSLCWRSEGMVLPSKHFWGLQTFERKCLAKVKNDGYENHL